MARCRYGSRALRRAAAAAGLLLAAAGIWLAIFFGGAFATVWLVETNEGEMSECWSSECGTFGELLDDHDLLAAVVLGIGAALAAVALLWRARRHFAALRPGSRADAV